MCSLSSKMPMFLVVNAKRIKTKDSKCLKLRMWHREEEDEPGSPGHMLADSGDWASTVCHWGPWNLVCLGVYADPPIPQCDQREGPLSLWMPVFLSLVK